MARYIVHPLLICLLLLPASVVRAGSFDDDISGIIRNKLEDHAARVEFMISGCRISSLSVLPELYRRREYLPVWRNADAVDEILRALQDAYLEGLDPDDYHLSDIQRLLGLIRKGTGSDSERAASLDILLTDAFIRLAYHSTCGKQDPVTHHPQWNLSMEIDDTDPVRFIEQKITSPSVAQAIAGLKISHPAYLSLKKALAYYRDLRHRGGWTRVPAGPSLKKGMIDPRVAVLRSRLAVTDGPVDGSSDPMTFDGPLEQAVIRFQRRHGLKRDGVVGRGTLAALNVPLEDRIDQIRVNLERARWMLRGIEERFVLVDIAGFRVFFFRDNEAVWSSRAQVGQPYRDTPVFRSAIVHVEFNPAWVVPPGIFKKDVLPEVMKDPGYLRKKDLTVIDNRGKTVDPNTITWSRYRDRPFPYMLRQNPGENSALGRIKIFFPNEYLVYLHDTPSKTLFEEEDRAFSSGCIRVEKPYDLVELLLDDPVRWGMESILGAAESGRNQKVRLPRPVTVLLMYWTVEVDRDGVVYFKKDPYKQDASVLEGLGRDAGIRPAGGRV